MILPIENYYEKFNENIEDSSPKAKQKKRKNIW
jgi:hypothetical protein